MNDEENRKKRDTQKSKDEGRTKQMKVDALLLLGRSSIKAKKMKRKKREKKSMVSIYIAFVTDQK